MDIFDELIKYNGENNIGLLGMTPEFFALYAKRVYDKSKALLIVTPSLYEANKIYNSLVNYNDAYLFQVDDISLKDATASPELKTERLNTVNEIINNNKNVVITDINGYLSFLPKIDDYRKSIIDLSVGMDMDISLLSEKLFDIGYERANIVTNTGEVGVRGFVIDIYPVSFDNPIRVEIDFDKITAIKYFDPETQKSYENIDKVSIYPNSFNVSSSVMSLYDYMNRPTVIFKDYDQCHITYERMLEDNFLYNDNKKEFFDFNEISISNVLYYLDFDSQGSIKNVEYVDFSVKEVNKLNEDIDKINNYLRNTLEIGKTVIIALSNVSKFFLESLNVKYILTDINNIVNNSVNIINYNMSYGFEVSSYVFLTEYELFNRKKDVKRKINFKFATRIKDISKLEIGDFVVHTSHGIGVYNGIKTISKNGILSDYLEVLYDKGDKLYIPASKIELLSKYSGKDGYIPKINTLNSTAWAKTKAKVKEKIKYEAERLLKVQAERELKRGFAFSPDTPMQSMFESAFKYEETLDQAKVTRQIKDDMESSTPMDRILCGDVGYGKTEVAFRAMFKAVQDSKQVLYLCPTTLLCKQQYDAAIERFKDFPVNIAMFSRFTTLKETNVILEGLRNGTIDIVFGTHRLLNDQVRPKDLGLLVIDEEQRFGVAHKEKIKEFKSNIDVLTLTATPIPRTLQLAMLGLKNLSLIETPPKNRHSIQTYVTPYDKKLIRDIVYKEISRNGQVFILYNKVEDIEVKKAELDRLLPDAKVIFAHGQMSKSELEDRMNLFISGEYNVLLCTTIIETGIDIPNANSLIILNADRFGLSQLYQIRGRVGRSDRVAYTYLMYDRNKVLTETAMKRLKVIKDFTELGSGFTIASRDLSIRGAGDILGAEQAGFIDTVGIDLYMQMLTAEVNRLKGIEEVPEKEDSVRPLIEVSTHVPDNYVSDEDIKIEIHKMINTIDSLEKLLEVRTELEDRFGKIDEAMFIYMNEELFENLIKKKGIESVNNNKLYIELVVSKEKSETLNYEDLFIDSIKISNKFSFNYKNNKFYIKLLTSNLKVHPVILLNELLYKM